jgi:hypothetical protein
MRAKKDQDGEKKTEESKDEMKSEDATKETEQATDK